MLRLTRTQTVLIAAFAGLNVIDVAVSALLFYGVGGYGEANPVFAWAVGMPVLFVILVLAAKVGAVGAVVAMTAEADRLITGGGNMVAGTATCMTAGLIGVMVAGLM